MAPAEEAPVSTGLRLKQPKTCREAIRELLRGLSVRSG
jgi:hypothetical protein